MGLSSTTNRIVYTGDGSSAVFSFPYYFFNTADLAVYLFDTGSSIVYPQALNTNFTVSGSQTTQGVFPQGGSVVMNSSFPSNIQIVITRSPSQINNYVLNQNGQINSLALVQQFDYLTALVQRLQDEVSRSVQLPDGLGIINNVQFSTLLPQATALVSSANAPLVLNSGATGFTFGLVATGQSGAPAYAGTLPIVNGGTGQNSALTPFGIWYSANTTAMTQTAAGPLNQVLIGQGASAPIFGLVDLTSMITGKLGVPNGGTGTGTSFIQYGVVFASSTTQMANTTAGGGDLPLIGNAGLAPSFRSLNIASGSSITGVLPLIAGGTGTAAASANAAFNALSPMTTGGDIIVGSGAGVAIRLANASAGSVLTANGTTVPPSWQSPATSPNISARYHGAAITNLTNSDSPLFYTTKDYDTNSAYGSGGIFTVPQAGKYHILAALQGNGTFALGNTVTVSIYINGAAYSSGINFAGGSNTNLQAQVSDIISCSTGHQIQINLANSATGPGIAGSNTRNYFAITYAGA